MTTTASATSATTMPGTRRPMMLIRPASPSHTSPQSRQPVRRAPVPEASARRRTSYGQPAFPICPTTCAIAPTPTPRNSTAHTGEYTKPPTHAPAIVGSTANQSQLHQIADRRPSARTCKRRHDGEPFGRVVQREADDQQRAERRLAQGERRSDGQPFAEVVQRRCRPRSSSASTAPAVGVATARASASAPELSRPR